MEPYFLGKGTNRAELSSDMRMILKLSAHSLCFLLLCQSTLFGMATIDENAVTETVIVDPTGKEGYSTIGEAIDYLNQHPDVAIKVQIRPGVYREGPLALKPRTAAATIIEGTEAGKVIITGADVWTDWTEAEQGLYYANWPYDWGEAKYDKWYKIRNDLGRRCEIVLLYEKRITQVAAKADLTTNSYFVDEAKNRLWIKIKDPSVLKAGKIEVSTRGCLFWFRQVNNLVLRNLSFINASSGAQKEIHTRWTVALFGNSAEGDMNDFDNHSKHLLIDHCSFLGNNSAGPTIACYRYLTITDCRFDDNGNAGAGINRIQYATIQNSTFNANNWRVGGYGEFYDWAPAGTKILFADNLTIKDCEFNDNLATGLWMDFHNENILITNIVAEDNYGAGVYLEASTGPFVVTNSVIRRNGNLIGDGLNHGGILIAESRNVTVCHNLIQDNAHGQIVIRTRKREESGGFFSGDRFDGSVKDIAILNNTMSGKRWTPPDDRRRDFHTPERQDGAMIMMTTHSVTDTYRETFLPTLWAANNVYSHESGNPLFSTGGDYGFDRISFEEWQEKYALDYGSQTIDYSQNNSTQERKQE